MKRLTSLGLALVMAAGGSAALADRKHDDHRDEHRGGHGNEYKHGYKHGYNRGHWYPRPYYRNVYYYPRPYYEHNYYNPLGAALIGAAVTYSIYHAHDAGYAMSSTSSEIVGCHRIERYPNGSERRVEVPLSECY
ncbi:MAG: hypothetical protein R3E64_13670 [Halioglobus sp.]